MSFKSLIIRQQLRQLAHELDRSREKGYDRQVRVEFVDDDLTELAAAINRCLDYLKAAKLETEAAEVSLRRSVSDIAHDLRTPLAVIKGELQLLERSGNFNDEQKQYLATCLEKTDTLKNMTDSFFELAVLESSNEAAALTSVDLTAEIMRFILDNEGRIRLANIEPQIDLPNRSVFVNAEPQLLGRMLGNLLSNALKYSGGDLYVKVTEQGCLSFSNTFSGERPDVERLFERSYRADSSRSGKGAGLGLYIVKLLAEKQNAVPTAVLDGDRLVISIQFN